MIFSIHNHYNWYYNPYVITHHGREYHQAVPLGQDGSALAYGCDEFRSWRSHQLGLPSGYLLHSELARSTIFNGKIHYFNGHFQ